MIDQPARQVAMRGGLAWLDLECQRRFDMHVRRRAADAADRDPRRHRRPTARSKPGLAHGLAFFRSFRDLTASGFWTSKMGMSDLGYMGNTVVARMERLPAGAAQEARPDVLTRTAK